MSLASLFKGTLPIAEAMNKLAPRGGVTKPIAKFTMQTIPKWTGLTPTAVTMGSKMGTVKIMAALVSIKVPMIRKMILIINRRTYLLLVIARIASAIFAIDRMIPKPEDIPIINMTGAAIVMACIARYGKIFQLTSR